MRRAQNKLTWLKVTRTDHPGRYGDGAGLGFKLLQQNESQGAVEELAGEPDLRFMRDEIVEEYEEVME